MLYYETLARSHGDSSNSSIAYYCVSLVLAHGQFIHTTADLYAFFLFTSLQLGDHKERKHLNI